MTVELKNGSKISFLLADNPVITYQNESLVINKDEKTSYNFEDVKNYHFTESDETKAEEVFSESLRFIQVDEETIEVQNAQPNTYVILTAINGTTFSKTKVDEDGKTIIKMPNQTGIFILSAGIRSFKIIRK
ncbi:MAG: hypothetical protein IKK68_05090 [Paludibacteraceae bacterium]|nr:hypothetical protein [Paludibacteraceae bacterium]